MTKLYQKCPDCGGTRRLNHEVRLNGGAFFSTGAKCPMCEDGYVEFDMTLEKVKHMAGVLENIRCMIGERVTTH